MDHAPLGRVLVGSAAARSWLRPERAGLHREDNALNSVVFTVNAVLAPARGGVPVGTPGTGAVLGVNAGGLLAPGPRC